MAAQLWTRRGIPFPELNLKQAWLIPPPKRSRTQTARLPAGSFAGRPAESSSRCRDRLARCVRCGPTKPCRDSRRSASEPMWPPGHTASLVSANPRWPNCLARTCCAQRTRWSRRTPASRPSTSVSRLSADHRSATSLVEAAAETVLATLGGYVWATGETTWGEAVGARLGESRLDTGGRRDRNGGQPGRIVRRRSVGPLRRGHRRGCPGGGCSRSHGRGSRGRSRGSDRRPARRHRARRRLGPVRPSGAGAGRVRGRDRGPDARPYSGPRRFDRDLVAERRASRDTAGVSDRDRQWPPRGPRGCGSPPRKPYGARRPPADRSAARSQSAARDRSRRPGAAVSGGKAPRAPAGR